MWHITREGARPEPSLHLTHGHCIAQHDGLTVLAFLGLTLHACIGTCERTILKHKRKREIHYIQLEFSLHFSYGTINSTSFSPQHTVSMKYGTAFFL